MNGAAKAQSGILVGGLSFLSTLCRHCLRFNNCLFCLGFGMDDIGLLSQLRLSDIRILPDMYLLEFFISRFAVRLGDCRNKKFVEANSVFIEIRR